MVMWALPGREGTGNQLVLSLCTRQGNGKKDKNYSGLGTQARRPRPAASNTRKEGTELEFNASFHVICTGDDDIRVSAE